MGLTLKAGRVFGRLTKDRTGKGKKGKYFRRGSGEAVSFCAAAYMIAMLFALSLGIVERYGFCYLSLIQNLSAVSRSAAVCTSLEDAQKLTQDVADMGLLDVHYISDVKTTVKIEDGQSEWLNGVSAIVTLSAKINTGTFLGTKTFEKSVPVAIEGGEAYDGDAVEVCKNIIYAVETGGQTYGNQNYSSVESPGANSSAEYYYTFGAGGWYGNEGVELLKRIRAADPSSFARYDTCGVAGKLSSSAGVRSLSSEQVSAVKNILNSAAGRAAQDAYMKEQIESYFEEAKSLYGVTDSGGLIEYMNIRHQGGLGAAKRLSEKASKPLTADSYYAAMQGDSGNEVGAYRTRQRCVYSWIKTYLHG